MRLRQPTAISACVIDVVVPVVPPRRPPDQYVDDDDQTKQISTISGLSLRCGRDAASHGEKASKKVPTYDELDLPSHPISRSYGRHVNMSNSGRRDIIRDKWSSRLVWGFFFTLIQFRSMFDQQWSLCALAVGINWLCHQLSNLPDVSAQEALRDMR